MKAWIKIMLLLALLFVVGGCTSTEENAKNLAPSFELVDLEGNQQNLADYAGQKVYVKFWASWCSICLSGMEELNTLAGEENDFAVLTIVSPSSNAEKSSASFAKWFEGFPNAENITVLLDEGGTFFEEYGIIGYPTSVYIGSDGTLVKSQTGHFSNEEIKSTFETVQ
ncbi:Thiol:disulfide oxidoreductase associated with MetSO reductase [Planococcus halocryophilus Or1]|uniref:Thioredoxin n=1 Tax=Planococcus halocryophilus TaxID=1215089 RepID=A0A1C7DVA9_9BACL|nr:redoxin family protein [Planococcus halocryophilus]ANU15337.1 thioredoxin [Planococcus halocryophilus]EMF47697.1 Thiol:disulfide oxidoreductase associated with MetSO reductase [Planococcus halocryophilus Or1]